jgi:hypothetical protein
MPFPFSSDITREGSRSVFVFLTTLYRCDTLRVETDGLPSGAQRRVQRDPMPSGGEGRAIKIDKNWAP